MKRLLGSLALLVAVAILSTIISGCTKPASSTQSNPASDRMGALAGIPAESNVPSGDVFPNLARFVEAGRVAGANLEASNIKMAARTFLVDHPAAPRLTSDDLQPSYISESPKSRYYISPMTVLITRVDSVAGGWADMVFSLSQQKWGKGIPDNDHDDDQDIP